jgi:hypothetical protein
VPGSESLRQPGWLNPLERHRAADDPAIAKVACVLAAAQSEDRFRPEAAASGASQGKSLVVVDPTVLERAASVLRLVECTVASEDMGTW